MPTGFEENVEIHCWGAGGGGSLRVSGGGGGYATTNAPIPAGSVVRLQVGQPGANGGRGNNPPSPGGTHPSYTRYRGGSAGSSRDEDGDTGSGGGGGGASAVIVDNSPVCVGAGGGGAGGPGDDSGSGTPGNPGGVYPGSSTNVYPVTLSYAWNSFMNSYAVWGNGQDYTVTINFPVTGTYTFNYAVDNYGQVFLDGSAIITLSGTVTSHFTTTTTYTATVSAGNHTVRVTGVNTGGPAGVAAQILKPDSSELWNTRALTVSGGLTATSDGGTSPNAWTSGGGGGGGYYGGEAGASYGDDAGNAPAGRGGQNYGAIIEAGSGTLPGGRTSIYYPTTPANIGSAGYPGYIVMKFTRKPGLRIKSPDGSGNWVTVQNSYVRTDDPRPSIVADSKIFTTAGTTSYTIPKEVKSLTITYLTAAGLVSDIIPVTSGRTLPVTVGDFGQTSSFGDYTMPAYSKQIFQYVGNVDHLLNADVQMASPSGNPLTTGGYNAGQTAAAAAEGLSYNVTYEGWHGDLYSTLYFTPVRTDQLLNNFQIVASGGGRGGTPGITAQPTVANGYIMGIQFYDGSGSEGGYNGIFTLQQQGYFRIDYNLPIIVSGWKDIQNIFVKNDEVWKSISQQNDIVVYNYT